MHVSLPKFPFFIRILVILYWGPFKLSDFNLIICKTLFPDKVTYLGTGCYNFNIFLGDTIQLRRNAILDVLSSHLPSALAYP